MSDPIRQKPLAARHSKAKRGTILGAGLVIALAALTACSGSAAETPPPVAESGAPSSLPPSEVPSAIPSEIPQPSAAPTVDPKKVTCDYRKDDTGSPAKFVGFPPKKPTAASLRAKTMTMRTNHGDIVIELTPYTPCTVNSFAFLAGKKYFDNTVCHRLVTAETNGVDLLQCGDPQAKGDGESLTDGTGGPGYLFPDENLGPQYVRGVVFMAQGGDAANSNGSQFAISFSNENAQLPAAYTPFGVVVKGMDIVDKIVAGGVNTAPDGIDITSDEGGSNAPKIPVKIKTIVVR
ncbi:putative peptidyl-prolyl cis-trans isomerase B [Acrocarpospora phusangensis]|uniref:Peptidyl-prolyl cis-trans isomerase B n=1 Tax=Acrocarpospora phusangensis TaxID=1070424 RepID=A0A919UIB7_9ACTN|nr:peptidylprolyl isomerase [Acrocarpospora phusangensis]GIH22939.1 putative peptidyl-prolyl cis-trans isomerase B [Acrocarpospora phusangensis]